MREFRALMVLALVALLTTGILVVHAGSRPQHEHERGRAHDAASAETTSDPAAALSPGLRAALREEMLLITAGMGDLVESMSLGDWEAVAKTASRVQHSFILEQKLTAADAAELHARLPAGLLRLDRRFHETAGKLVHAAHARDAELATLHFFRLLDGCLNCHGQYAPNRFPGLSGRADAPHEHHPGHEPTPRPEQ